ncbi:MAG: malate dehydrogenase, partial [Candidatus Omnitrophota bacterium]
DIVIVTAGFSRKPGMTREDLLFKNSQVISTVAQGITRYTKDAIVIVVTNPLDAMTYVALKATGFNRFKLFGMGSSLDSSRFANLISKKLFVSVEYIEALVIASHGEGMLPLSRLAKVRGKSLTELLDANDVVALEEKTRRRGAEIVSLYDTGSAFYGPSAALFEIAETILSGHPREIPVSVFLEGEYGVRDVCLGVPALIGSAGIEKIIELDLNPEEKKAFQRCAQSIKESLKVLKL